MKRFFAICLIFVGALLLSANAAFAQNYSVSQPSAFIKNENSQADFEHSNLVKSYFKSDLISIGFQLGETELEEEEEVKKKVNSSSNWGVETAGLQIAISLSDSANNKYSAPKNNHQIPSCSLRTHLTISVLVI